MLWKLIHHSFQLYFFSLDFFVISTLNLDCRIRIRSNDDTWCRYSSATVYHAQIHTTQGPDKLSDAWCTHLQTNRTVVFLFFGNLSSPQHSWSVKIHFSSVVRLVSDCTLHKSVTISYRSVHLCIFYSFFRFSDSFYGNVCGRSEKPILHFEEWTCADIDEMSWCFKSGRRFQPTKMSCRRHLTFT